MSIELVILYIESKLTSYTQKKNCRIIVKMSINIFHDGFLKKGNLKWSLVNWVAGINLILVIVSYVI